MNELTETRAELEQLKKQEQQVRAAVRAQKTKLQELIRQVPAPINRLPNEVLLRIFQFFIQSSNILTLGAVSYRWRDVTLQCPSLWSTIKVTQGRSTSLLEAQVARSAGLPLKIDICNIYYLNAMLDILIPCAVRWQSLTIQGYASYYGTSALTRLNDYEYPSLTHVSIRDIRGEFTDISYFYSRQCPHLEYLELESYSSTLQVPHSVTFFSLHLTGMELSKVVQGPSLQKLTSLTISRWEERVELKPNSIQLPLLEKLACTGEGELNGLLQAIVAPNLIDLQHESRLRDRVDGDMLTKFPNITSLVLSRVEHFSFGGVVAFRFPAIRHVDVGYLRAVESLFASDTGPNTTHHLPHLESLTVRLLCPCERLQLHSLVAWLKARQNMDVPRLLVKFGFSNSHQECRGRDRGDVIYALYASLHEYCRLEWINVPLTIVMSGTVDDLLQLVCAIQLAMSKLTLFRLYRRCQKHILVLLTPLGR